MTNASITAFLTPAATVTRRAGDDARTITLSERLATRWALWRRARRAAREAAALQALASSYEATSPNLAAELRGLQARDPAPWF